MSKNISNKFYLWKELNQIRKQDNVDMLQHLSNFNGMISQLIRFEVKFSDEEKAVLIMATLPPSYDHLITTFTYGKDRVNL
ncbi:hypothetical protein F8388_018878 [Cannabis sativa]|uniref:Retrovirus-related Pol polyprotein from transposon TNT 1-94 n=1 Tax=Cannabis sativa TaxID=3483 RepID=A0A7J6G2E8_CANSA|nr:hypothetical protein F8388_018878 [Cannabis sativa]